MKTFIIQSEKLFEGRLIATQPRKDLKVLVYLNGVVVGKYIKTESHLPFIQRNHMENVDFWKLLDMSAQCNDCHFKISDKN